MVVIFSFVFNCFSCAAWHDSVHAGCGDWPLGSSAMAASGRRRHEHQEQRTSDLTRTNRRKTSNPGTDMKCSGLTGRPNKQRLLSTYGKELGGEMPYSAARMMAYRSLSRCSSVKVFPQSCIAPLNPSPWKSRAIMSLLGWAGVAGGVEPSGPRG